MLKRPSSGSRYDIISYSREFFSYYDKVVPKTREELVKFINDLQLNFPFLVGLARRYAAVLTAQPNYASMHSNYLEEGFTDIVQRNFKDIWGALNLDDVQMEIYSQLYFFPRLNVTILPKYDHYFKCSHCGKRIDIGPNSMFFEFTLSATEEKTGKGGHTDIVLKGDFECPIRDCGGRNTSSSFLSDRRKDYKEDATPFLAKVWNPYYVVEKTGIIEGLSVAVVNPMRFREVYPTKFVEGEPMTYADVEHMDPNFFKCMMKDRAYILNPEMTYLFVNKPRITGLDSELSPALLNVVALMHSGTLRRGNEADSRIKANPNFIVTPTHGEASSANTRLDGTAVVKNVMTAVKEVQERDTGGIFYMPFGMQASKLFSEPRRTTLEREIREEELNCMAVTGLDASILNGVGLTNDPFILHALNELLTQYSGQFEEFSSKIVKALRKLPTFSGWPKNCRRIPLRRVDQNPGTMHEAMYQQMAEAGLAPVSPLLEKFGFNSVAEATRRRKEEDFTILELEKEFELKNHRLAQETALQARALQVVSPEMLKSMEAQLVPAAEHMAEELVSMDEGAKRSQLDQLQKNNIILYSLVIVKLRELNNRLTQEAKAERKAQG